MQYHNIKFSFFLVAYKHPMRRGSICTLSLSLVDLEILEARLGKSLFFSSVESWSLLSGGQV